MLYKNQFLLKCLIESKLESVAGLARACINHLRDNLAPLESWRLVLNATQPADERDNVLLDSRPVRIVSAAKQLTSRI